METEEVKRLDFFGRVFMISLGSLALCDENNDNDTTPRVPFPFRGEEAMVYVNPYHRHVSCLNSTTE